VAATSSSPLGGLVLFYALVALIVAAFVVAISTMRTSRRKVREAERKMRSGPPAAS
jgi:hypothetical protein